MRRKTINLMTMAVLAVSLLIQGCEQPIIPSPSGSGIRFKTSTNWGGDVATKTVYGDVVTDGGLKKQRIDWVVDDHIRIYSDKASFAYDASVHYADYRVERVYSESSHPEISYATVQPGGLLDGTSSASSQPNGLVWGEGLHKFVSVYPSPADITSEYAGETFALTGGDDASSSISRTFAASLPASQTWTKADMDANRVIKPNMDFAYMYAMAAASAGSEVTLSFKPMFTAFQFTIDSGDDAFMWLKKFTLKSNGGALAGKFSATVTVPDSGSGSIAYSYAADDVTDAVELTFLEEAGGTAGIKVVKESPITFTVFALPVDYEAGMSITVESDDMDGSNRKRTLELKNTSGEWVKFEGCKKYNITLGVPGEWEYVIDNPADITLTYEGGTENLNGAFNSYRRRLDKSQKEKVAYKLQYSTDNGTTWTDGLPDWLTSSSTSGYTGSYESDDVLSLTMAAQENTAVDTHGKILKDKGTAAGTIDLSTINVATGSTVATTTANCYVVQQAGTYKFPLVYGNGIVNGAVNEDAFRGRVGAGGSYRPDAGTEVTYSAVVSQPQTGWFLGRFKDHRDQYITSPYIATQLGTSSSSLTATLVWTDEPGLVTNVAVNGDYLTFDVPQATITQGNALVAVLAPDGKIAWSWHIWVTDHNLTKSVEAPSGYAFPHYNLGWCDYREYEKYLERSCLVRAVQTVPGGTSSESATVLQEDYLVFVRGNCPFYEWGRKDPLQASNGKGDGNANNKTYYATSGYAPQNGVAGKKTLGEAIQTPYIHYTDGGATKIQITDWCSVTYFNSWNSSINGAGANQLSAEVTKTIYDPSPVGFTVPPQAAFFGFNQSNLTWNENGDKGRIYNGTLFFPAAGDRGRANGVLSLVGVNGYFWSANPCDHYAEPGPSEESYIGDSYIMNFYNGTSVTATNREKRSYGFPVRPVVGGMAFGATTGGQQSGGEYNGSQLNNGWGDGN